MAFLHSRKKAIRRFTAPLVVEEGGTLILTGTATGNEPIAQLVRSCRLIIDRSLVRAQVGSPSRSKSQAGRRGMAALERLTSGSLVRGVAPDGPSEVVNVQMVR